MNTDTPFNAKIPENTSAAGEISADSRMMQESDTKTPAMFKELKAPSVFIVDDIPKNLQVLSSVLSEEKYNIAVATSGEQAIDMIRDVDPDIVLLDIMMPGVDGFDVCRQLKSCRETFSIPVIFLTAKNDTEDIVSGFKLGAVDFVSKPFNAAELKARVRTHIELKRSRDIIIEMNKRLTWEIKEKERFAAELEKKNGILEKMAITDSMTGLYNHRTIIEILKKEITGARRYSQPLSILMIDIDHFKMVNDTYGHPYGDKVLIQISSIIKELLRDSDSAGRYGGEEFLVILPRADLKNAGITAERIRSKIEDLEWDADKLRVTISGGLATLESQNSTSLIKQADNCLYQAKHNGRNQIRG